MTPLRRRRLVFPFALPFTLLLAPLTGALHAQTPAGERAERADHAERADRSDRGGFDPAAAAAVVTEERVREVVSFLAADERMGRDTPSPGLTASAEYLARRFEAAGLQQAVPGSWLQRYELRGQRVDSDAVTLTLVLKQPGTDAAGKPQVTETVVECTPGEDVRLWRAGSATSGRDQEVLLAPAGDPRVQRMLRADAGRRPVVLEIAPDSNQWQTATGVREVLARGQLGTNPILLLRQGKLPDVAKLEETTVTATWTAAAAEPVAIEVPNVVGVLRGASKPDEYVLVSAHFDHIGVGEPVAGDAIRNGADDDASGTTAVVLIAQALQGQPRPARSVAFVCFSGEEKGLRGSAAFAEQPPFPLQQIVANVNVEMIGRPEPGKRHAAWITGREYSDFAAIVEAALAGTGVELVDFPMATRLFAASDNFSLARRGVVAHSISAGSLHEDYHMPSDEVGKLDLEHMTTVIRALAKVTWELADREGVPQYNEAGRKQLKL